MELLALALTELDDESRLPTCFTVITAKNLKVGLPIQVTQHQIAADRLAYRFKRYDGIGIFSGRYFS